MAKSLVVKESNAKGANYTKVSTIRKLLEQYNDDDTIIIDIWAPDIIQGLVEHAFEEVINRDEANSILEYVTEEFEDGYLPVNPEILSMVETVITKHLDGIKQNTLEIANEPQ
ncbi:MAG TPA: hypothetical protein EYQ00_09665 [Dehalococcoidia bacterium]|jgi:hypothetical protein|nr:hypothetical protein [Dehalococcoidia bacterium]